MLRFTLLQLLLCVAILNTLGTEVAVAQAESKTKPSLGPEQYYEPSPAFPFGRLNPKAPPETAQFSFMIGEFDCNDEIINPQNGKWVKMKAIWNARYFLNGMAIQDQYWSPPFSTSNIRIFDSRDKKWKVTFFRMPGYAPGPAISGQKEGDKLVMRQGTEKQGGKYTFFNIRSGGFDWVGENLREGKSSAFWKSSCKRRR